MLEIADIDRVIDIMKSQGNSPRSKKSILIPWHFEMSEAEIKSIALNVVFVKPNINNIKPERRYNYGWNKKFK